MRQVKRLKRGPAPGPRLPRGLTPTYNATMVSPKFRSVFHPASLAATLVVALAAVPAQADQHTDQHAAQAKASTPAAARAVVADPLPLRDEPVVQYIVIEDDGARIDELHVRGEAQRIQVQPKGLSKRFAYEVLPASGARDLSPGPGSTRGAAGQRVWSVLSF